MKIRFMGKSQIVIGLFLMIMTALSHATSVSANGYGGTQAEAEMSATSALTSKYPNVTGIAVGNCHRPSYGPPWQCTAYGTVSSGGSSSGGSCTIRSVVGYGTTESDAQQATYSIWQLTYPSAPTPGISCTNPSYGPPWQCTATGCI